MLIPANHTNVGLISLRLGRRDPTTKLSKSSLPSLSDRAKASMISNVPERNHVRSGLGLFLETQVSFGCCESTLLHLVWMSLQ